MATNQTKPIPFASVLENNKLDGTNFNDWYRTLRIILKAQKKEYVLDAPADDAPRNAVKDYERRQNDSIEVSCLMLVSMSRLFSCVLFSKTVNFWRV